MPILIEGDELDVFSSASNPNCRLDSSCSANSSREYHISFIINASTSPGRLEIVDGYRMTRIIFNRRERGVITTKLEENEGDYCEK